MTAQDLKNSILQLAVQGKLVPQDPNDEPASALLHRVMRANGLKEIPYSNDDIPFDIPETWKWVKLGSLCNYGSCVNIEAKNMPANFWILDLEDIEKDTGRVLSRKSSDSYTTKSTKHVFHSGAVLYSKLRPYLNKVVVAEEDGCCTSEILPLDFGEILPKYAQLCLMSPYFISYANNCSYGVKMPRLGTKDGKNAMFALAPLEEQKRIVAKIEELLPLVERYDESEKRLLELNKKFPDELRKSILQQAVQGKLTEQDPHDEPASELLKRIKAEKVRLIKEGKLKKEKPLPPISLDEIPFDIPEGWEWVKLNEVARVTGGYAFKSTDYSEKGVRVIRISDFNATGLVNNRMVRHRFENFLEMFLIEEKNILLCMTGGTVGKSLMIEKIEEPMMTNQRVATIKINKELLPEFINIVILSPNIQNIIRISKNSTNDNISMDTIKNFPIPVPPLGEQKHIVEKVKGLLSACDMMQ